MKLSNFIPFLSKTTPEMPEYGMLYFDHLYSEYQLIKHLLKHPEKEICEEIEKKRETNELTWNEVYTFQMVLLEHQDIETLKSRIISLRIKFQNLADASEYADYLMFRAVDLKKIEVDANEPQSPPLLNVNMDKLRADLRYLMDEFYMRYAYTSARENLRTKLLRKGAIYTLIFFIAAAIFLFSQFFVDQSSRYSSIFFPFITMSAVVLMGIMGAFVSMQQRLHNISAKGDPIYNLSLLTHGWLSIALSPMSGAIFALILYLIFSGKILEGTFFPVMTLGPQDSYTIAETPYKYMSLKSFILGAHPETSKDYALLLVWSFVAGFAERFVPDTLMRIVNSKKASDNPTA
jgi:hypothetical protein